MKQWFAIRVKSRAEKKAGISLAEKNIEFYLPLQKKLRRWSDRKKIVEIPVIHGYLFVKIAPTERMPVLQTPQVAGFVRFEGKDAIIPDKQIAAMKCMLGQSDYPVEINVDVLKPGQKIKIIVGMMTGMEAELITLHGKNRTTLRVPEISFNLMIDLPLNYLEAV